MSKSESFQEPKKQKFGESGMDIYSLPDPAKVAFEQEERIANFNKQKELELKKDLESGIDVEALSKGLEKPFESKELIGSLANLVLKLREKLPQYDTIISDDASGRLVSLILHRIINKKKEELGRDRIPTYFIAGGQYYSKSVDSAIGKVIDEEIKKRKSLGKTLLVTEYIESGDSIEKLIKILESKGIDFDVAAVSIIEKPESYKTNLTKRLYYGEIGGSGLELYNMYGFSGVIKDDSGETAFPVKYKNSSPEIVRKTRTGGVNVLADRLSDLIK